MRRRSGSWDNVRKDDGEELETMGKKSEQVTAEQKSARFQVKATDDAAGTFRAVVSVFGNVDSYGDRMLKGSFAKSLDEWEERGAAIPFLWDHAIQDPFAYVGELTSAKETDEGLEVEGRFDMDDDFSRKAYRLMKSGRVREFSFGFFVRSAGFVEDEEEGVVREVKDVDLIEVSMTQIGANRETRLVEVRHAADGRPEVRAATTTSSESSSGVVQAVSLEDLDAAVDALDAARATIEETLEKLKAARATIEANAENASDDDAPKAGDGPSDKKDEDHAAASPADVPDEEPTGAKSGTDPEAAAATVRSMHAILMELDLKGL